jgi:hypothetical protein
MGRRLGRGNNDSGTYKPTTMMGDDKIDLMRNSCRFS